MKLVAASCSKLQSIPSQTVWAEIESERPDALLLLGDNVYLDHDHHDDPERLAAELRALYRRQLEEPHFASLLASLHKRKALVAAIYDDHDFLGNNRCGGEVPPALREAARQELVTAFSPARTGADVYRVHHLGPVDLVLADTRFYRRNALRSAHDRDAVLGAQQWQWLEQVVRQSTAPYLVLASSTTLHTFGDESWEQYPVAFGRLTQLLAAHPAALVLSGDVHRNAAYDDSGTIEIVTSGVARRGLVFGGERRNYGVLSFGTEAVRVQLRSLKAYWRFDFTIARKPWAMP
ncbi:MAG: alkaline phosphatase D family protein [Rubrivivax sp.]|nr:alkaline phosphatase D family protein [Rubrivivax sp.]